jgi:alpha-D-ribose 1-methylphosphonate 5-triphosphate synthase subunit PhnG
MNAVIREDWVRALSAHPAAELKALAKRLSEGCELRLISLPQAGLGLLTMRDGALGEAYYLGEFPLSACRIEIAFEGGGSGEGGSQVLADDADLARSLAILDAILASKLPGWQEVSEWVVTGELRNAEKGLRRKSMLAATKVDFSLLSTTEEDGDEG